MRYSSTWTGSRNLCSRTADWRRKTQHCSSRSTVRRRPWPKATPATKGWGRKSKGEYPEQRQQPKSWQERLSFTMFLSREIEGKDWGLVVLSLPRHKFQMRGFGRQFKEWIVTLSVKEVFQSRRGCEKNQVVCKSCKKSCSEFVKLHDWIPIDPNLPFSPIFSLQEAIQLRQQHECENEDLILKLQDQKQEMQQKVGTSKVFVLQWSTCVLIPF